MINCVLQWCVHVDSSSVFNCFNFLLNAHEMRRGEEVLFEEWYNKKRRSRLKKRRVEKEKCDIHFSFSHFCPLSFLVFTRKERFCFLSHCDSLFPWLSLPFFKKKQEYSNHFTTSESTRRKDFFVKRNQATNLQNNKSHKTNS